MVDLRRLYHNHGTIVSKSETLKILEPSGSVINLCGDCFTSLRSGQSRFRNRIRAIDFLFSTSVQTEPKAHSASATIYKEAFPDSQAVEA